MTKYYYYVFQCEISTSPDLGMLGEACPITNDLYTMIIDEAYQLNLHVGYEEGIAITFSHISYIKLCDDCIQFIRIGSYLNTVEDTLQYTDYTSLKDLLNKWDLFKK